MSIVRTYLKIYNDMITALLNYSNIIARLLFVNCLLLVVLHLVGSDSSTGRYCCIVTLIINAHTRTKHWYGGASLSSLVEPPGSEMAF